MIALTMPDPIPLGLMEAAELQGHPIIWGDGLYWGDEEAQRIIDCYDPDPATKVAYNKDISDQILALEASITPRMWREDAVNSEAVMNFGADDARTGKTATQYIAWVDALCAQIRSLRR